MLNTLKFTAMKTTKKNIEELLNQVVHFKKSIDHAFRGILDKVYTENGEKFASIRLLDSFDYDTGNFFCHKVTIPESKFDEIIEMSSRFSMGDEVIINSNSARLKRYNGQKGEIFGLFCENEKIKYWVDFNQQRASFFEKELQETN